MPLWGSGGDANSAVKWAASSLDAGSGNAQVASKNAALIGNTTVGAYVGNETVAQIYLSSTDISSGSYPGSSVPGWYIKRSYTGGRSGRSTYELLVSFSAATGKKGFLTPQAESLASPSADAWCWFHEPRALAAKGKTWFGTTGSNDNSINTGRASFYEIDEVSGSVSRFDMATGNAASTWADDHDYPAPCLRPDGRLVVFYCPHRTGGPIKYRISVAPYTMANGWSQEYSLGNESAVPTYPSPVILTGEANKMYLFYRNGFTSGPLSYVTSADIATVAPATVDGGALGSTPTWAAERQLAQSTGTQGIYHKVTSNNVDRIDILCTDAVGPQAGTKNDVRHVYWNNGQWRGSNGTALGDGSSMIGFTNFTAVATSGAPDNLGDMWCHHIQRRSNGIIEAVFWRFISTSDHRCYYARWDGTSWKKYEVDAGQGMGVPDTRSTQITDGQGVSEGYYSPGAFFDVNDEGLLYISVGNQSYSQMYRYQTVNQGVSWTRQRVSGLTGENVRPVVPVGRSSKYGVLWLSGAYHYFDFSTNPAASDIGYTTRVQTASRNYSGANASPVCISAPTIAGITGTVGNVLQGSLGSWTGDMPTNFGVQWSKGGADISGANAQTYTIQAGDAAATNITFRVTGTNFFGNSSNTSAAATSNATNLVTHSETMNSWTLLAMTTTTNVANDPVNNAAVADRFAEGATLNQHSLTSANMSFVSGTTYTFSVYAKYETAQFIQLLFGSAAFGSNAWGNFDMQNGLVQTVGSAATCSVVNAGNGWFRLIMTATASGTASGPVAIFAANAGNMGRASSFTGVATNTRLLVDAQVETGSTANPYQPVA